MAEVENIYNDVNQKIDKLIAKHEALKQENQLLRNKLDTTTNVVNEKDQVIDKLNEQIKVLSMAKSLSGESGSNKDMKLKINELVREIDKCISLLNN